MELKYEQLVYEKPAGCFFIGWYKMIEKECLIVLYSV